MARFGKNEKKSRDDRPIQVNDFIYNDPDDPSGTMSDTLQSDTPDEAIRKFRGRPKEDPAEPSDAQTATDDIPQETAEDIATASCSYQSFSERDAGSCSRIQTL